MRVKYVVLVLAAVCLLAAGCNKQAALQTSQPSSNVQQANNQTGSGTADEIPKTTGTEDSMMNASGTMDDMMMNGTSTMMNGGSMMDTTSSDEMMQK